MFYEITLVQRLANTIRRLDSLIQHNRKINQNIYQLQLILYMVLSGPFGVPVDVKKRLPTDFWVSWSNFIPNLKCLRQLLAKRF